MRYLKKNKTNENNNELKEICFNEFGISRQVTSILIDRGFHSEREIKRFLYPNISDLCSPFMFKDMMKVVTRIKTAIKNKELICIWGDFDCDGICSATALSLALSNMGGNILCHIPDRHNEGYGLNNKTIKSLKEEKNINLIITVDCGITAVNEVAYAKQNDIDVIITDHHNAPDELPDCIGILDAKVKDETYPFKELCGAGVVFKLIEALTNKNIALKYVDIIAIATVADVVPLISENRIIVSEGLKKINMFPRKGIEYLCEKIVNEGQAIESYHLGYKIGPMINACGRVGNTKDAVKLLSLSNEEIIKELGDKIFGYNETRKNIEENILTDCLSMLNPNKEYNSIVLYNDKWDTGVIGIVASRLAEKFYCPVIVFGYDEKNNVYHGSGRSIDGISLYNILKNTENLLEKWGGHDMAAGLNVKPENMSSFIESFDIEVSKNSDKKEEQTIYYDLKLDVNQVTKGLLSSLKLFEPTGMGNLKPVFLSENISVRDICEIGFLGKHFKCEVFDKTGIVPAIAFNNKRPSRYERLDTVYTIENNLFKGKSMLQINIKHIQENNEIVEEKIINNTTCYGVRTKDLSIGVIEGLSEAKLKQFNKADIYTINDLIHYFPKKYMDFRNPKTVSEVRDKDLCSIKGYVKALRSSGKMIYAMCSDANGDSFMVCWFNQDYIARLISVNTFYNFCGTIKITSNGFVQMIPMFWDREPSKLNVLMPIYKKITGMSQTYLADTIKKAFSFVANTDYLTEDIVKKFNLLSEYNCLKKLHFPDNNVDVQLAEKRQVFDELFKFNFVLKSKMKDLSKDSPYKIKTNFIWDKIKEKLPYNLTGDQNKTLNDMYLYTLNDQRLNGLVQGDVGSGKTIVAFFMLALAYENGFQSCMIAPTEVLAKQHYQAICDLLNPFGINIGLLTGSQKAKEKRKVISDIKTGLVDIIIGTHAIIQDSVEFLNLGMVVVDEQHKFGVEQREKLLNKENKPHFITMSATPIPRTLSMALYGDNIQVYNIKQKPAGRKDVITQIMTSNEDINEFMLKEIKKGRQCYIVCPLIDESESDRMASVKSVAEEETYLRNYFKEYPEVKISAISGKMKQADIAQEIDKFVKQETNILLSTTIIEVGVNVPNSTVMVIKSSERFGLAQLHQLRGRVGRGNHQSYCLLQTNEEDRKAGVLCSTNDGFEIAKQDLLMRGTGDFIGTQQTGNNKSVMLMLAEPQLYKEISKLNDDIYANKEKFEMFKYMIEEDQ